MHVTDGFLDLPTSVLTAAIAAAGVACALRGARRELDERVAPLAGLVATFVFAAQMVNFPVGAGTSGHLIGGALAAVLVGPFTATLCLTVVTVVQALLFADGGLTALGTNLALLALVAVWTGWAVALLVARVLPRTPQAAAWAGAAGALVSVPVAGLAFTGLFAIGGTVEVPLGLLATTMVGVQTLIGLGEAVITFGVLSAVLASRPDLVHPAFSARPDVRETAR